MENQYDIIVIGAGPAGSTAARFLSDKYNKKVLLLDKEKFPRDKPCGGYLTNRVFKRFSYLKPEINELIEVPTFGSFFYGPDLMKLAWIRDFPVGYLVLRTKFDNYLKDIAISKGVEFLEGKKVIDLHISESKIKVLVEDGSCYYANMIIGADGARSLVAKWSKITAKSNPLTKGLCIVYELKVEADFINDIYGKNRPTHYFYGFNKTIGYSWVFPKKNHINVGIGGPSNAGKELKQNFLKFLNYLKEGNLLPEASDLNQKIKAALIPTSTALYLTRSYSDRILLAGDALGVVSSVSGEGIYQSMASGEDAAFVANEALEQRKFDAEFLQLYDKVWKKDLASELKTVKNVMQLGSAEEKEELYKKLEIFFKKMEESNELFDYFARTFFGME
jgi:geranylgeranyl reductase family protein